MGRPIKKKFFGNLNGPDAGSVPLGSGVGGESFTTVAVTNAGANGPYSTGTTVTWTASAPQITGGEAASGTATVGAYTNKITAINVSNAGSGYTSTSSVTITFSPATTGTAATYVVGPLTTSRTNALAAYARVPGGTAKLADIIKQEASHRYLVQTSDGQAQCKLVASNSPAEKEMYLVATDWNGSTYWVTKLTARRARLKQRSMTGSYLVADGTTTGWTIGSSTGTIVTLANN